MGLSGELKVNDATMYFIMAGDKDEVTLEELNLVFKLVDIEQIHDMWMRELLSHLMPELLLSHGIITDEGNRSRFATKLFNELGEEEYGKKFYDFVHKAKKIIVREILIQEEEGNYGISNTYVKCAEQLKMLIGTEMHIPFGDYPENDSGRYQDVGMYIFNEVGKGVPSSKRKDRLVFNLLNALDLHGKV